MPGDQAVAGRAPGGHAAGDPDDPVDQLGARYEAALPAEARRATGAFFTPRPIAEGLLAFACPGRSRPATVCDPAVGGGAFLLAAARWLERSGLDRTTIVRDHLWGADTDPDALAVTERALRAWCGGSASPGPHLVQADSLLDDGLARLAPDGGFDLVVGNPPFLSQLARRTARSADEREALRARFGDAVGAYTDPAALFLLAGLDLLRDGGRLALLLPDAFLATRDAAGVRRRVLERSALDGLWTARERVFGANVDVVAPVLVRGRAQPATVRRAVGPGFTPLAPVAAPAVTASPWSSLVADVDGVPTVDLPPGPTLGEVARATAGFRDEYYALRACVVDEADDPGPATAAMPKLVTSGLIDPGACAWGVRPARFQRRAWRRPRVDLARLARDHPRVARWAEDLLVPKVVVATQTRVVEAAVDVQGCWYPSTPTVAVIAPPDTLWQVAAVLLAPAVSVWARRRVAGAALGRHALKLSASDVTAIPLPPDEEAWGEGARLLEAAVTAAGGGAAPDLDPFAAAMGAAYRTGDDVLAWWGSQRAGRARPGTGAGRAARRSRR